MLFAEAKRRSVISFSAGLLSCQPTRFVRRSTVKKPNHIETKIIHAGEPNPRILGAVSMPIFQSAMFEYAGETSYHDLKYIRLNNTPNQAALGAKLAALENAEAALVTSSGMAAISTALISILSPGGHLLAQNCLYGGTHDLVTRDLTALGMSHDFIDANDPESWERKLTSKHQGDLRKC